MNSPSVSHPRQSEATADDVGNVGASLSMLSMAEFAARFLVPLSTLALWLASSKYHWLDAMTLPTPGQVLLSFEHMLRDGSLARNAFVSIERVGGGFLLGFLAGLLLGISMGLSRVICEMLYPTFRVISYIPIVGWLPVLMLFLGIGEALKVALLAKAALTPVTLNTYQGIRAIPVSYIELSKVYRLGRLQLISKILLPGAAPLVWTGIRYGLSSCWQILILVEMLAASEGLGYMVLSGQQLMQMDVLFVAIIVIGIIGYAVDKGAIIIGDRFFPWQPSKGSAK